MLCCTLHSCRSSWHLFQWLHYELEVFCKLWSTESEVSVFSIFHMQTFRSHSAWCHRMNNRFVYYAFMCTLFFLVCDLCSRFKLLFFFFWVLMWEKQQLSIHGRCTMHHHLLSSKLLHKTKRNAGGREARRNQKLNKFSAASFVCTPRLTLGSFRCRYIVNIIICNITSIIRLLFCLQNSFILLLGLQVGEIFEVPFVQNLILKSFICSVLPKASYNLTCYGYSMCREKWSREIAINILDQRCK